MKLNFDSKSGVFTIKAENEKEKAQLKTSAVAICNLIIDFSTLKSWKRRWRRRRRNEAHPTQGHRTLHARTIPAVQAG